MKKLKHKLKLLWLRKKWILQSVYNTEEFKKASDLLKVEREWISDYHKAKREDDKLKIAKTEGGLEIIKKIKEVLE